MTATSQAFQTEHLLELGFVIRVHGLHGGLLIRPHSDEGDVLMQLKNIIVFHNNVYQRLGIKESRMQGIQPFLRVEKINTRTVAESYVGARVFIEKDQLPSLADDEYYLADMLGIEVVHRSDGRFLGRIVDVESAGAQQWLIVENTNGQREQVPFMKPLVELQMALKKAIVDAPEGMLWGHPEEIKETPIKDSSDPE